MANRYETMRAQNAPKTDRRGISIRLPADLFAEVEQYSEERRISLNAAMSELLGLGLDALHEDLDDGLDDDPSETVVRVPR